MLALALGVIALSPVSAQQADIAASQKRFNELYAKGNYPAALLEAQKLEALVKARLGADSADYATALLDLANVHWKQGRYGEAGALYERALPIREQALGPSHPFVGHTLNSLANAYLKEGRRAEAEGLYQRALAIFESSRGANHADVVMVLNNLAFNYRQQGRSDAAEGYRQRAACAKESGDQAIAVCTSLISSGKAQLSDLARIYQTRGFAYALKRDQSSAIADYSKAIEIDPDYAVAFYRRAYALGATGDLDRAISDYDEAIRLNPSYAFAYGERGAVYARKGDFDHAIRDYNESLRLNRTNAGDFNRRGYAHARKGESERAIADYDEAIRLNPNFPAAFSNRGDAYKAKGEIERAIADYKEALRLNPNHVPVLNSLASAYLGQANYGEAEPLYQRVLAIREQALGANHPDVAQALNNLGLVLQNEGRYDDAESVLKRALAIREALGANHPLVAQTLSSLGGVYNSQGRSAQAQGLFERALAIREQAFGADSREVAYSLSAIGNVYRIRGRYAEAEALLQRALAILERELGASHLDVAQTLHNLALVFANEGKYAEAEALYKRSLAIREQALGENHPQVAWSLSNLGGIYQNQGKYPEAETFYKRAIAIRERVLGEGHPDIASDLNSLAFLYDAQGKYAEAERLYKRALGIQEQRFGPNHPALAATLNDFGLAYMHQSRYAEAEGLFRRSLAIKEQVFGANHPAVAPTLNNLGFVYRQKGKQDEAEELFKRSLAIREQTLGTNHPFVARTLSSLVNLYRDQRKYAEAESLARRQLAIAEQAFGAQHPEVAYSLNNIAKVHQDQRNYAEAEGLYRRSLAIMEVSFGANHPGVAYILDQLASIDDHTGRSEDALVDARRATAAILAHAAADLPSSGQTEQPTGLIEQRAAYFRRHVAYLGVATRKHIEPEQALADEALITAQWAAHSSAASALHQMTARFAGGQDALSTLVRQHQDLAAQWREADKTLVAALSEGQERAVIDELRKQMADIERRRDAVTRRLEKEFPDYAALATPKPLPAQDVQRLLGSDEALLFWLTGDRESYVFALTQQIFTWRTLPVSAKALSERVANFRQGLNVAEVQASIRSGKPVLFDLGLANELYATLLGPVEELIKDKRHLLVVPTGALTSLPFQLLVVEKPTTPRPSIREIAVYRDAGWLIKRHALSVLPSVASLKALRAFARKDRSGKPLVGFGDPVFDPAERASPAPQSPAPAKPAKAPAKATRAYATRAYSEFWKGSVLDRSALYQALPSLPETADELKAVAAKVGAPTADIHLGQDASEAMVKRAPLADYRVIYFATHGLVAGEVKGLGEPALALTMPPQPTDLDDGLLTAGEVAQLKLNADWVVLSACNTAAGEKPGAEALSGLARAFFYAGARALLVSHWSVDSEAAAQITTSTFDIMAADGRIGRAEALRRAMLVYMNDASSSLNGYPGLWGAFSLIGEGAAHQD